MRRRVHERGVAAVEAAIVVPVLLLLAIGAIEFGFALEGWLSAVSASREGARVASQAGDEIGISGTPNSTDCAIIEAAAGPLVSGGTDVLRLWIYKSDATGAVTGTRQIYRRTVTGDTTGIISCGSGQWTAVESSWPASMRLNDGLNRDWVGVRVEFDHSWLTGFLWFSGSICEGGLNPPCWRQDTVMKLEPDLG